MKVLLAVHHFPPAYTGGAEWEAYNTASALKARGHEVRVLCVEHVDRGPVGEVAWVDDVYNGLPVRRLSYNCYAASDPVRLEYDNAWIGAHVQKLLAEWQPDLFHVMGGYLISGRALRIVHEMHVPTIVTLMDFWYLCRRISLWRSDATLSTVPIDPVRCARCLGEEQRRYRWLGQIAPGLADIFWRTQRQKAGQVAERLQFLRQTLNQVDAIIGRSQFLCSVYVAAGIDPERIDFLRQGRDFPGLTPEAIEKTRSKTLRVGYIGQITEHKGVHVLLEAARALPKADLTVRVYGNAEAFPAYTERLRRVMAGDARIQLAGVYRSPAEQLAVLRELDVLVVPSVWYENSPNVILEAFAHRTPVITSKLGGMAELVRDGEDGLLFVPGDAADLAHCLQRMMDDPELLTRLRAGIRPVPGLASEIDELEVIYRRVVNKARQPSLASQ